MNANRVGILVGLTLSAIAWPLPPGFRYATDPVVGAKCDGVSDDTAALQTGLDVYKAIMIPTGKQCIIMKSIKMRSGYRLLGEDMRRSRITNNFRVIPQLMEIRPKDYVDSNVLIMGNWGAQLMKSMGAVWTPRYIPMAPAVAGAKSVSLILPQNFQNSSDFSRGHIVAIKSAETFSKPEYFADKAIAYPPPSTSPTPIYLPKFVQLNRVVSRDGGNVILEKPLNFNFGSSPQIGDLTNATENTGYTGIDGEPFYVAQDLEVGNLTLETTTPVNTTFSSIHGSGYKLNLHDLVIIGKRGPGFNPSAYSTFKNIGIYGIDECFQGCRSGTKNDHPSAMMGFETAYLSNNNTIDNLYIERGSLNVGEVGSHITVTNTRLGDGRILTANKHNLLFRNIRIDQCSTSYNRAVFFINQENEDNKAESVSISDPGYNTAFVVASNSKRAEIKDSSFHFHSNIDPCYVAQSSSGFKQSNNQFIGDLPALPGPLPSPWPDGIQCAP